MVSRSGTGRQTLHMREPIGYALPIRPLPERYVPGELFPPLSGSRVFEAELAQSFFSGHSPSGRCVGDGTIRIVSTGFAEQSLVRRQIRPPATDDTCEIAGQPQTGR